MPCDQIRTSEIDITMKPENKPYLLAALRGIGMTVVENGETVTFSNRNGVRGSFENGKMVLTGSRYAVEGFSIDALKRGYSGQIVMAASQKIGWNVKQTGEGKFQVAKRGF